MVPALGILVYCYEYGLLIFPVVIVEEAKPRCSRRT